MLMHPMASNQALLLRWLLLAVVLVFYGSLFPFEFSASERARWELLLHSRLLEGRSIGDILGNIALFVPYGFLGTLFSLGSRQRGLSFVIMVLGGSALAILSQLFQLFVVARDPALADAIWNLIGLVTGGGIGWIFARSRAEPGFAGALASTPGMLLLLWALAELVPLVPSIDFQQFKDSLKPLLFGDGFDLGAFLLAGASVLLLGECLAGISGRSRSVGWLASLLALTGVLKILVVTVALDRELVLGWSIGLLSWWLMVVLHPARRRALIASVALIALVTAAVHPFEFSSAAGNFHLLPFASLLQGSMLVNARSLVASFFLFAALLWLLKDRVRDFHWIVAGLASLVLALEVAQVWIVGRVAAIDEPLLVLIAGILVAHFESLVPQKSQARLTIYAPLAEMAVSVPRHAGGRHRRKIRGIQPRPVLWVVLVTIALGLMIYLALRLPGLPYNVRELFLDDGAIHRTTLFGAALLWIGMGAYWVGRLTARSRFPVLVLPAASMAAGVVSLALVGLSVTSESVADVAGSTNIYWFVTNKGIWGETAAAIVTKIGPATVGVIERAIRYTALYGPVVGTLGLLMAIRLQAFAGAEKGGNWRTWYIGASLGLLAWLLFCKVVTFDYSSTDNLNELIAPSKGYGVDGGVYLYLLLALFSLNALLLLADMRRVSTWAATAIGSLLAVALGWVLLNQGLNQAVEKYGLVFSGVQFLLGPDRQTTLSDEALFGRWALVYLMALGVVAVGLRLAQASGGKPSGMPDGRLQGQSEP